MTEEQREKITPLMIKGFQDAAEEGGQTVVKPWIIVGVGLPRWYVSPVNA